ncbi:MAG: TIGR04076 family protein [Clostridiales bacterium]|nr:TIGR04076 family protein [Clostridiales bacterium]
MTSGQFGNKCSKGFCAMAWQAVCLQATTLADGGMVFGHDLIHIACCNDGVRPVIFRLEPYEDDEEPVF